MRGNTSGLWSHADDVWTSVTHSDKFSLLCLSRAITGLFCNYSNPFKQVSASLFPSHTRPLARTHIHTQITPSLIRCRESFFFTVVLFGIIGTLMNCLFSALCLAPVARAPRHRADLLIAYVHMAVCKDGLISSAAVLTLPDSKYALQFFSKTSLT
jgi:hypothetical protein